MNYREHQECLIEVKIQVSTREESTALFKEEQMEAGQSCHVANYPDTQFAGFILSPDDEHDELSYDVTRRQPDARH